MTALARGTFFATAAGLVFCAICAICATAQIPEAPTFDVAVVKPADPANTRFGIGFSPNGRSLTVDGLTIVQIIQNAYGVFPSQVSIGTALAGSKWIDSERYDITAKAEGDSPLGNAQSKAMLQQLLADRFALRISRETKEITVYALVAGKTGPKFKEGGAAGPYLSGSAPGKLNGQRASMASLASALGRNLGRPAIDETGLKGGYDFSLEWAPGDITPDAAPSNAASPSIFTAIQDQLGLRLESRKSPVEVLVIDHVEKPSPN